MNLSEMYHIIEKNINSIDFEKLWPGFHPYDFAIYNDETVCLNGQLIPKTDEFLANTAILYKERWTAIFKVGENEDSDIITSKIIHEMFHAFQHENNESRFPNEIEAISKYDYTVENITAKLYENKLLVKLLNDKFDEEVWAKLLESKKYRLKNSNYSYTYEAKVEQIEGTANYIELKSLKIINKEKYEMKLREMLKSIVQPYNLFPIRISLYNSGALLIKIIEENNNGMHYDFTDTPYSISLVDSYDYTDVTYEINNDVKESINHYYQDIDELIKRLTKKPPIKEGSFELTGLNVYNAKYYRGYIYTTYFLAYRDENDNILYGNYLIKIQDSQITKIYSDDN